MRQFSIKELERFSNIKAHTIRVWEKRFGLFAPQRLGGNVRSYSLDEVCLLLDISLLNEYGYKISRLQGLPAQERAMHIASLKADKARQTSSIHKLLVAMFTSDTEEFEAVLDSCLLAWSIDGTIQLILIPFLEKVQILSYKVSTVEAHLVVTAIRRKLILGIEKCKAPLPGAKTALLFLPEDEHYDLVLLYINYILKMQGLKVIYLGTNTSLENLEQMLRDKKPDRLYTYIADKNNFPVSAYTALMQQTQADSSLYIAYADDAHLSFLQGSDGIHFFRFTDTHLHIPA